MCMALHTYNPYLLSAMYMPTYVHTPSMPTYGRTPSCLCGAHRRLLCTYIHAYVCIHTILCGGHRRLLRTYVHAYVCMHTIMCGAHRRLLRTYMPMYDVPSLRVYITHIHTSQIGSNICKKKNFTQLLVRPRIYARPLSSLRVYYIGVHVKS